MRKLALLAFLCALAPQVASAQTWPALDSAPAVAPIGGSDVAVLVAIEDYLFVPSIPGARNNLTEWELFLREGLGVPTVRTLVNEQATREEVLAAADAAAQLAGPSSTVWFLFIGHGAPSAERGDGMLLGVDAQQTTRSLEARGISRSEILERLDAGAQERTVVVLDACFSGRTSEGAALVPDAQPLVLVAEPALSARTVVLSAAMGNEFAGSMPGLDRPAFSYLVLGGLRGWADSGDGVVTADEAVAFARTELLNVPGRRQTPTISGLRDTPLSREAREARPALQSSKPESVAHSPKEAGIERTVELERTSFLHAAVTVGAGGELAYETATPLVDLAFSLRLTNPRKAQRLLVVAGLGYANINNVFAREVESAVNEAFQDAESDMRTRIDIGTTTHMLMIGAGPGIEIGRGPLRFFGDIRGGFALPLGGECRSWEFSAGLEATRCLDRESALSQAFGARLGIGYKLFEVAAQATFMPRSYELPIEQADGSFSMEELSKTLFVAGLTAGIGFDL